MFIDLSYISNFGFEFTLIGVKKDLKEYKFNIQKGNARNCNMTLANNIKGLLLKNIMSSYIVSMSCMHVF